MTFMPKQIQEAFHLTDRLLNNPKEASSKALFKALSADGDWQEYTQGFQKMVNGELSQALEKAGKSKLDLSFYCGEEGISRLLHEKKTLLSRKYRGKSEAEIKQRLKTRGAGHFSPSLDYVLFNSTVKGSEDVQSIDIQMMYLHELTHLVDNASIPDIFKKLKYLKDLKEGKVLQDLSDTDLQNLLNTVYLEEHAHGQTIRLLNKNFKDTKNADLKTVAQCHTDRLKVYWEVKKSVIQEMKRRKAGGAISKEAQLKNFIEANADKIKTGMLVLGGLLVAGLSILGFHHFSKKQAPSQPSQDVTPNPSNQATNLQA